MASDYVGYDFIVYYANNENMKLYKFVKDPQPRSRELAEWLVAEFAAKLYNDWDL
jgi:hypothetical protein